MALIIPSEFITMAYIIVGLFVYQRDVVLGMVLRSVGKVFVFVGRVADNLESLGADFVYYNMNLQQVKVNI